MDFVCAVRVPGGVNCKGNVHGHRIRSRLHDKCEKKKARHITSAAVRKIRHNRAEKGENMKKMNRATRNKSIALFLALTMASASMAGCGSKDDNDEPASEINLQILQETAITHRLRQHRLKRRNRNQQQKKNRGKECTEAR